MSTRTTPAYNAAYRASHRLELYLYNVAYRAAHKDRVRAQWRAYRKSNLEVIRARSTAWRRAHPLTAEQSRDRQARYRQSHPEQHAHNEATRRARKIGNGGSHTVVEWCEKLALFARCCAYCGEARPLTRDHKIPLARGGTHDIGNIVPACRSCNSRKGARTAVEFIALRTAA